ncbi:MAG TPA: peptidoglycan DD-metalloendopeptidase family protein [Candidatus Baltobacteraceae bacterium]|nr:peptidoglycan DD-metalloendopeptidase family protein [Candidatus Baltobacteraceae bacterium]
MNTSRTALALAALLAFAPQLAVAKSHGAAAPSPAHARTAAQIEAQRAKVHNIHLQLNTKKAQLEDAKTREAQIKEQLDEANRNIGAVNGRLDALRGQMKSTQRKLDWNKIQLAGAQATLRRHQDALNRRLVDAYEQGDLGYLDVLLRARSFSDFVERWNDIRYLVKANEATIRARKADEARIAAIQSGLIGAQAELQGEQDQVEQQQRALAALAVQRERLLDAATAERQSVQNQVAQLDEISEAEEARLEALVAEAQREAEAEREAQRRARMLAGESVEPEPGAPGQLMWPVSGPITSPFGWRMHPVYHRMILHAGIDIGVPTGTTVAAAAAGTVIVAGYEGDCGNMVAIDHGGGLSTMYCHLSQIFVGVKQQVQRGQAIGAAGATGDATGPHVHFQVMLNGKPVDPMGYLH